VDWDKDGADWTKQCDSSGRVISSCEGMPSDGKRPPGPGTPALVSSGWRRSGGLNSYPGSPAHRRAPPSIVMIPRCGDSMFPGLWDADEPGLSAVDLAKYCVNPVLVEGRPVRAVGQAAR